MSLKDKIYMLLEASPKADSELTKILGKPRASVRRARNELVAEKKVIHAGNLNNEQTWKVGTPSAAESDLLEEAPKPKKAKEVKKPNEAKNTPESSSAGKLDWRDTGFTF
jgi:hypothetical protein